MTPLNLTASIIIGLVVIALIIWILPTYPLPLGAVDALTWVFDTLWAFNFLIPVPTLMRLVTLSILLIEIPIMSLHAIIWLKNLFAKSVT